MPEDVEADDGRKTHVRYPDGGVQRSYYDACGNLIKQILPEDYDEKTDSGKGMTFAYDEMNRLTTVWDRDGKKIRTIVYDLAGRVIKDSNAKDMAVGDGTVGTTYRYNLAGWLQEVRVPVKEENGQIYYRLTTYGYDKRGNRTTEKRYLDYQSADSAAGRVLRIQRSFDKSGRLVKVTDSLGSCIEYAYDTHNKPISERRKIRDGVYQEKVYTYTKNGNLESVKQSADAKGCGRTMVKTEYRYNRNGKVTSVITPTGNEIRRAYDRSNRLWKEEYIQKDGKIHTTIEYSYDTEGRLSHVKQNGKEYIYGYDCRGRRNLVTENTGNSIACLYDKNGRLIKEIGSQEYKKNGFEGRGRSFLYKNGRLQEILRMDGSLETAYTYNEYGEMIGQQDGNGAKLTLAYDHHGRRTHASMASGAEQEWSYDAWGNIERATDGNGNLTTFTYDGWGKVTRVDRADGGIETYGYDAAGNLNETTDGKNGVLRFLYNNQNRLEERIDQTGQSEYWNYDADGRCCLYRDRNGQETTYTYNMLGSLTGRRSTDDVSCNESFEYTPEGYLSTAIGGGMRYDYDYDEYGRIIAKKASGRTLLSYAYDAEGRVSSRRDLTGKETAYRYNEYGFLEKVMDNGIETAVYDYTPDGRIAGVTNGELRSTYAYDAEGSLQSMTTMLGEELLVSNSYSYDNNGNCVRKETLSGVTEYSYDCMNRLEQAAYPHGTEKYSYDYADNRICMELFEKFDTDLRQVQSVQYEYDERNRLLRSVMHDVTIPDAESLLSEYHYDNQGNMLSDGEAEYSYDAFNRMEKAERHDGQVQVNHYDAEGLRHEMEENGKLVQFLYSGREVVAETESDGNVIRYIRGLGLVCSDNEKAKTYYHYASDEMGSITHVVEKTKVLNCYEYDAFGNTTVCEEQVSNRFRFTGQQYDTVTGQYYLRARYYNPVIGRFLQEDNYYGDGLNLYAYCKNNPVSYVDPSGHGTQSAATKHSDPNSAQNAQDLLNLINEMNNTSGATADDIAALKSLAEEFGMNPNELDIRTVDEVNGEALKDIAKGANSNDASILKEWANEYHMDPESLVGESGTNTITVTQDRLQHSTLGEFNSNGRLVNGGHGQANIDYLDANGIPYNIVKEYPNGVRVGNIPNHKNKFKRTGTGQAWFPKSWTDTDIKNAGEYVANLPENKNVSDGTWVFGEYNGVRVGIIKNDGEIGTIIPDNSRQP